MCVCVGKGYRIAMLGLLFGWWHFTNNFIRARNSVALNLSITVKRLMDLRVALSGAPGRWHALSKRGAFRRVWHST